MVYSDQFFTPMRKCTKDLIKSYSLMIKSGMIQQLGSGLFSWLPLGMRVLNKIEAIVHKYHEKLGFNKCIAPNLHPAELWHESGRYDAYGPETLRVIDRHKKELILGPTAEEVFAHMIRDYTHLCKINPLKLYNIQWKYRDEIRPRFGIMRSREFLMSDAYSFHTNPEELADFYNELMNIYNEMFSEIGFESIPIQQHDTGAVGGSMSHEFFAISDTAENEISFIKDGAMVSARGTELGHIYDLGTKYSVPMKITLNNKPLYMGCYGVGVTRLVGALVEIYGDLEKNKILWPKNVAPFKMHIIGTNSDKSRQICSDIYNLMPNEIYYDNSSKSFGEKMAIADLIGAPIRIIAMNKELDANIIRVNNQEIVVNNDYLLKIMNFL